MTNVSSFEMWNTSDILIVSVSRQKASEATEEGWCLALGFGQKKCTSMCMIAICIHLLHLIYFHYFSAFTSLLPPLCLSGISVSIIVFSRKSLRKVKIIIFLQWGFYLLRTVLGSFYTRHTSLKHSTNHRNSTKQWNKAECVSG